MGSSFGSWSPRSRRSLRSRGRARAPPGHGAIDCGNAPPKSMNDDSAEAKIVRLVRAPGRREVPPVSTDLKTELAALAAELGFARFGVARAERLEPEGSYLARYVAEGRHGSMGWLADTAAVRADPRHEGMLPSARS